MNKLKMMSADLTAHNIDKIAELFPMCVTEVKDAEGNITRAIDFDLLKQELSASLVEGPVERYQLDWPGKRESLLAANAPIAKTLRPAPKESVDFEATENLFIEGDNLEALKLLQESYLGKFKLIYADPPYNTGNDILYKNNFHETAKEHYLSTGQIDAEGNRYVTNYSSNGLFHSNWLNMIYPRLRLTRNLLQEDGFLCLAIDHNELANFISIIDEIYGEQNRVGIISVVHKPEGRNQAKFFGPSNEFMLVYAKNIEQAKLRKVVLDAELAKEYQFSDEKGLYKRKNFIRLSDGKYSLRENKPSFFYPIYVNRTNLVISMGDGEGFEPIYPITQSGQERTWKTTPETFWQRYEQNDIEAVIEDGKIIIYEKLREDQVIKTHWIDKKYHGYHYGTKLLDQLLGAKTFDFPKSLYLIKDILKLMTDTNDFILDFFAGSSTTAHAVMQLNAEDGGNRKFIMVQLPEATDEKSEAYKAGYQTIAEISKERIRRAGKQILESENIHEDWNRDIGFRVFKVDSSNMKEVYYHPAELSQADLLEQVDNVKADRTPEDLLFQVMLDWGLELSLPIATEEIEGKKVFFVAGDALIACFDAGITESLVQTLAAKEPLRLLFRDNHYLDNDTKINAEQLVKQIAPNTELKSI
ncbi:site-specific DNA-methyltransferase [Ignatzschineria ureiclastica]|uniref:site-specific DNA-methyltransferase (adenine-specific) n=1 Tax=Ignatzschineria ureiclastica TaxID=472582 RepID=A0A2U2ACT1_9GAMM|nr:site-specific DNA-methyltransferase [Ignatzschineria ureiclastica]PWD80427.1 site-specific DNA-methyltransferase [Ignatzschineria ureiclastica]